MDEQHIAQALGDLAAEAVPANLDLWPAVRARIVRGHRPAVVWQWAGVVLLLVVLLGMLGYGAAFLARELHSVDPVPTLQAGLGQPLHLIQSIEGVTVSVQHIYVDPGSVAVALAISGTDSQRYMPYQITLTNAAGAVLSQTVGSCTAARPDLPCYALVPRKGPYLFAFALPAWSDITSTVWTGDLRLAVKLGWQGLLSSTLFVSDTHSPPAGPGSRWFLGPYHFDFHLVPSCVYGSHSLVPPPPPEGLSDQMVSDRALAMGFPAWHARTIASGPAVPARINALEYTMGIPEAFLRAE